MHEKTRFDSGDYGISVFIRAYCKAAGRKGGRQRGIASKARRVAARGEGPQRFPVVKKEQADLQTQLKALEDKEKAAKPAPEKPAEKK